jgi:hypothetical protein
LFWTFIFTVQKKNNISFQRGNIQFKEEKQRVAYGVGREVVQKIGEDQYDQVVKSFSRKSGAIIL